MKQAVRGNSGQVWSKGIQVALRQPITSSALAEAEVMVYVGSLLSKTGTNLATRVANGGLACPELEF
jgi:hypothetical protein